MSEDKLNTSAKFSGTVANCYDSHVHWQATGALYRRLPLTTNQGEWITGFGWNQVSTDNPVNAGGTGNVTEPHEILDREFGDCPVFFIRIDGHAAWVNKAALSRAGLWRKNPVAPPGPAPLQPPELSAP